MSIRPIDINIMQRMQDVSQIKQNEIWTDRWWSKPTFSLIFRKK